MLDVEIYGNYETAWCPGCGNFPDIGGRKKSFGRKAIWRRTR